ncbi:MAG: hypothetical protein LH609_12560 [Rudanella sp.]|nr:hypothetical protein [Rudanella sp.]
MALSGDYALVGAYLDDA